MVMAAQTKTSWTANFAARFVTRVGSGSAARIAGTVLALALAAATAQASATLLAAKCSAISAAAAVALPTSAMFDSVSGLLPSAGRGLALCVFSELVQALGFQQFSSSIWQILQVVGSVAGQSFLSHVIWSAVSLLVGS
jgi:hypothetical protein